MDQNAPCFRAIRRHRPGMASAARIHGDSTFLEPVAGATSRAAYSTLRLSDFPIPAEVHPDNNWTGQMRELAGYVGARATLILCDAFGGRRVYIPAGTDTQLSFIRMKMLIGERRARALSRAYGRNYIIFPMAKPAISRARRAMVIAHVRHRQLTLAEAAQIIGVTHNYVRHLVNSTNEGAKLKPEPLPEPRETRLLREAASLASAALRRLGATDAFARDVAGQIADLGATSFRSDHDEGANT